MTQTTDRELVPDDDRRKFIASCGRFALVTAPAITLLLSTSLNSKAIAHSGGVDHNRHGFPPFF
jgi:hypothetical protein